MPKLSLAGIGKVFEHLPENASGRSHAPYASKGTGSEPELRELSQWPM
jgi:hypothetical protein